VKGDLWDNTKQDRNNITPKCIKIRIELELRLGQELGLGFFNRPILVFVLELF